VCVCVCVCVIKYNEIHMLRGEIMRRVRTDILIGRAGKDHGYDCKMLACNSPSKNGT
jgi:hypothetical protein